MNEKNNPTNFFLLSFFLLSLVIIFGSGLLSKKNEIRSRAQGIESFYCLGSCPHTQSTSKGTLSSLSSLPSAAPTTSLTKTKLNPCIQASVVTAHETHDHVPHHAHKKGSISSLIQQLLQLLIQLLNLLSRLLGGDGNIGNPTPIPVPSISPSSVPSGSPSVIPSANPSVIPCVTTVPTTAPTKQQPSVSPANNPIPSPIIDPNAPSPHAKLPPGQFKTCRPTITVDASKALDLDTWLKKTVVPILQDWYSVIGDLETQPEYMPTCNYTIVMDPTYTGVAYATKIGNTPTVVVSVTYARANKWDLGMFIHESTHILQNYTSSNTPGWVAEGLADYSREYIYQDRAPRPPLPGETYTTGYSPTSYFFNYVKQKYDSKFLHDLNVAAHIGTYTDATFWVQKTGKTLDQVWTEMMNSTRTAPGPISGIGGSCIDLPNGTSADGTLLQLLTCNATATQQWIVINDPPAKLLSIGGKCMDVQNNGTTDGTPVWLWTCNAGDAQKWIPQANGTLLEPHANKCLSSVDSTGANQSKLQISTCNASSLQQKWKLP